MRLYAACSEKWSISLLNSYLTPGSIRLVLLITMIVLAVVAVAMGQREGRDSSSLNLRQ